VLRVLEGERFVSYDEGTRQYALGSYLFVLGNRAALQIDILSAALPYVAQAAKLTGLTCILVERYGRDKLMYLAKEEPSTSMRISVTIGQRLPLTAGSHGKCFLAWMRPNETSALLKQHGLSRFTKNSVTDTSEYLRELDRVRKRGYATSIEEHVLGINGVAAPIFDASGRVSLAISAIGTAAELNRSALKKTGETLQTLASRISSTIQDVSPLRNSSGAS
jgi:DNA-binding IclR family transcriptional regulator